jgi:hypothetical protein
MYKKKQIVYSQSAIKALSKIPAKTAELIKAKIVQYAENPLSLANNVSALKARFGVLGLELEIGVLYLKKLVKSLISLMLDHAVAFTINFKRDHSYEHP